jgi:hypothetical protein
MSIEDDIDNSVYSIRHAVQSIRDSIDTDAIDCDLDTIEYACDDLSNLEEDDPYRIISNALDDMGLGDLDEQWNRIDVGTANDLKEAVTRILKEHGYNVG